MTEDAGSTAYSARAHEYAELLGSIDHAAAPDTALITDWARGISGPVLDVGCGAGQWTQLLVDLGCEAEGIDPVPEFIDIARSAHPHVTYRRGRAEFARCIRPGGGLALGFVTGQVLEPFDHAVATAWFWPVDQLQRKVEEAGFTVTHTETRTDPGSRPHGALLATRR